MDTVDTEGLNACYNVCERYYLNVMACFVLFMLPAVTALHVGPPQKGLRWSNDRKPFLTIGQNPLRDHRAMILSGFQAPVMIDPVRLGII